MKSTLRHGRPLLLALLVGCAHQNAPVPVAPSPQPAPPARAPAPLFDDLGTHHRAISTRSAPAQRYFDQGLRLIYAFNHDEAQRSFEEAARLDPGCAMCQWGAALTLGPNYNLPALPDRAKAAHAAERQALKLRTGASAVEQALIEALGKRYADPPPAPTDTKAQAALDAAYAEAMRDVARRFPDDDDVVTLFAESLMDLRPWKLWSADGKPEPGTLDAVAALEQVLARNAEHPGANHYYIHVMEASPHPEKALPAAARVGGMMTGAGHLVHMPSHVLIRVGRYAEASEANRRAIAADQAYVAKAKPQGFYAMYVAHNFQFLAATAMMEGRSAEALKAARAITEQVPLEMARQMPGMDYYLALPLFALVRFGQWDAVLAEPEPPKDLLSWNAMWHYARGMALCGKGRLDEAAAEQAQLAALVQKIPADLQPGPTNAVRPLADVAVKHLSGELALRRGKQAEGLRLLEGAVQAEDHLGYGEPPDWYTPTRHTLGARLLTAGKAAQAEAVYRADLRGHPDNGWALFGLARSLRAQKKNAEADKVQARFDKAWINADLKLTATAF